MYTRDCALEEHEEDLCAEEGEEGGVIQTVIYEKEKLICITRAPRPVTVLLICVTRTGLMQDLLTSQMAPLSSHHLPR